MDELISKFATGCHVIQNIVLIGEKIVATNLIHKNEVIGSIYPNEGMIKYFWQLADAAGDFTLTINSEAILDMSHSSSVFKYLSESIEGNCQLVMSNYEHKFDIVAIQDIYPKQELILNINL